MSLCLLLAATPLRAQNDLPKHVPGETFDFEPKLMLDGPRAAPVNSSPSPSPGDSVQQIETALLRAQSRAADADRLFQEGILAKVEAEARVLRVIELTKQLADARLAVAAAHAEAAKKSFDAHEASQSDLDSAAAALKTARETAAAASADWGKARLEAAALDLKRKRKLFAEGVISRREVQTAEDRLVLLSGTGAP